MAEIEFTLEHNLSWDEITECVYDLFDSFEETDSFDSMEWDDNGGVAYINNNDLEVEITATEHTLEVWAEIHAPDLRPNSVQRDLETDISQFFGLNRPRRSSRNTGSRSNRRGRTPDLPNGRSRGRGRRREAEADARGGFPEPPPKSNGAEGDSLPVPPPKKETAAAPVKEAEKAPAPPESSGGGFGRILLILLVIGAIVGGIYYYMNHM